MLTEHERQWLENRKPGDWCVTHDCSAMFEGECISVTCYMDISWLYREAAEFEGKVVAKLAKMMLEPNRYPCRSGAPILGCMRDWSNLTGPMAVHCEDCILREVRLQVEEEMEKCIK